MRILAIDTATDRTSVAVIDDGKEVISKFHKDPLAHGEVLPKLIREINNELQTLDAVAIGMGPGPFTGLRSGIAFGQNYALARHLPWVGVGSLDALAKQFADQDFIVQIDARRKEVFYARFTNGIRVGGVGVCHPDTLKKLEIPIHTGFPNPLHLAALIEEQNLRTPLYVRRPDAYPAPKGVKFRNWLHPDLVSIVKLERESFEIDPWTINQLKSEYQAKDRYYIVAEIDGQIVGYAGVTKRGESGDVLTIAVSPDARRKGIGRELLRRLIDWSRTNSCEVMMLEVRVGNLEAMPLYNSFGFVEISRRKNYYGPSRDAIVMRKELR